MDAETTQTAPAAPIPLYDNNSQPPSPDAPLRDLPPALRPIFQALRELCLKVPGAAEHVRHEGPVWKWIWAYERNGYTVCAIHPLKEGVDLSFPLPTRFEPLYEKSDLDDAVKKAVTAGETAARVKYVRVNVPDAEAVTRLFRGVEFKLELISQDKKA